MTRTQKTVTLTIHADCTVLASLGQRDYAHKHTDAGVVVKRLELATFNFHPATLGNVHQLPSNMISCCPTGGAVMLCGWEVKAISSGNMLSPDISFHWLIKRVGDR